MIMSLRAHFQLRPNILLRRLPFEIEWPEFCLDIGEPVGNVDGVKDLLALSGGELVVSPVGGVSLC